jgi:hypothetical protein
MSSSYFKGFPNSMNINAIELSSNEIFEFLINAAIHRPVFIWGSPGIGKSSLVNRFAHDIGYECVTLLGSQLAPEDLIGIPKIEGNSSKFFPPSLIVRDKPFVLFIDELNTASPEIQKAFYSLILDKKIGEYHLPKDSIIIGAGNRTQDSALVNQMPSALINRMIHIQMKVSVKDWLDWAQNNEIHHLIIEYIKTRPFHLYTKIPPTKEEPLSTPRSWEYVSDVLKSLSKNDEDLSGKETLLDALLYGTISQDHAKGFKAYIKQIKNKFNVSKILKGEEKWPEGDTDGDLLYFLINSFRDLLHKELPINSSKLSRESKELVIHAKNALKDLSRINNEFAQIVISENENGERLPSWFLIELSKELPRLMVSQKQA